MASVFYAEHWLPRIHESVLESGGQRGFGEVHHKMQKGQMEVMKHWRIYSHSPIFDEMTSQGSSKCSLILRISPFSLETLKPGVFIFIMTHSLRKLVVAL